MKNTIYCPVCRKNIEPDEFLNDESSDGLALVYVHDDIDHDDNDIAALSIGIQ